MEFQSPIISGSNPTVTGRLNQAAGRRMRPSNVGVASLLASPATPSHNRHYQPNSSLMSDDLSQTYIFDSDPTFTRIGGLGLARRTLLDETKADMTMMQMNNTTRKKRDEELMSMLLEEDVPGVEDVLELFESFLQTFKSFPSEHQVFDQSAEYESQCSERVDALRKLIQMAPQGHNKLTQAQELEEELRLERDTWRLVTSLYQDRLNSDCQDNEMESEEMWSGLDDATSEHDLVKQLYNKNTIIRQAQLVVDWLERRAADVRYDTHYNQVLNKLHDLTVSKIINNLS